MNKTHPYLNRLFGTRVVLIVLALGVLGLPRFAMAQQDKVDDDVEDVSDYCDFGYDCELESLSVIYDTSNPLQLDVLAATYINFDALDDGFGAYVCAEVDQDDAELAANCTGDDGSGDAELLGNLPLSSDEYSYSYAVNTDSYLEDLWYGGYYGITSTGVDVAMGPIGITSTSPPYMFVGTNGSLTISGQNLVDPFGGPSPDLSIQHYSGSGSGVTLSGGSFNSQGTQGTATYQAALTATTGTWDLGVSYSMGDLIQTSTNEGGLTVGDPTPSISSVSPNQWTAGQTNFTVTITGSGFSSNPQLTVSGAGASGTIISHSDTGGPGGAQITANVSVQPGCAGGTAVITVTSQGYNGSGFTPAYSGQSSTVSSSATVLPGSCVAVAAAITDASNIVNGVLSVQLTGAGQSGQLTIYLTDIYGQISQVPGISGVSAGSQNVSIDLSSIQPDVYVAATASWQTGSGTANSPLYTFPKSWTFFGYVFYTQYNVPSESQCSGGQTGMAYIVTPQCTFTKISLNQTFISQAWLNGTGISISHGILKNAAAVRLGSSGKCAGKYPTGAIGAGSQGGNTFAVVASIIGSCGTVLTNNRSAAVPAAQIAKSRLRPVPLSGVVPLKCSSTLNLDASGTNTPQYSRQAADLCPACGNPANNQSDSSGLQADGHVDSYTSNPACTAHSLGGNLGFFYSSKTN